MMNLCDCHFLLRENNKNPRYSDDEDNEESMILIMDVPFHSFDLMLLVNNTFYSYDEMILLLCLCFSCCLLFSLI